MAKRSKIFKKRTAQESTSQTDASQSQKQALTWLPPNLRCFPMPLYLISSRGSTFCISDQKPYQSYWEETDPGLAGVQLEDGYSCYRHLKGEHETEPLESNETPLLAFPVCTTTVDSELSMLLLNLSRVSCCFTNGQEALEMNLQSLRKRFKGVNNVGYLWRDNRKKMFTHREMKVAARRLQEKSIGITLFSDTVGPSSGWDDELLSILGKSEHLSSAFHSPVPMEAENLLNINYKEGNIRIPLIDPEDGKFWQMYHSERDLHQTERTLVLGNRPRISSEGFANVTLPPSVLEILTVLALKQDEGHPTTAQALMKDLHSKKDKTTLAEIDGMLQTAQEILGMDDSHIPYLHQDEDGNWKHHLRFVVEQQTDFDGVKDQRWFNIWQGVITEKQTGA